MNGIDFEYFGAQIDDEEDEDDEEDDEEDED